MEKENKNRSKHLSETSYCNLCSSFSSQHCGDMCEANALICHRSPSLCRDVSLSRYLQTHDIHNSSLDEAPSESQGRGLLEKTGWWVDDSVLWPTAWMGSLLSSLEDERCTQAVSLPRQIWQTCLHECHLSSELRKSIRWVCKYVTSSN